MSVHEAMQRFNAAMEPIQQAIDNAIRSGVDPESIQEGVDGHLSWWTDELSAGTEG